ncbi:hypothetical protein Tamer19_61250 [Cupriavidus sp. TA19]|uniref:hypothetical protein n=1 Tax=unclassified Cupriavidus TaxID=2640874 RepID=UPI000E2F8D51|nr:MULTISPECIES: hypothetical protein [unclassified Cupriavidus]BDB28722.1 hypothetical protein CTP10_R61330 [Cupriavidus sp. P-10]GLC96716.1 hypothetical protein Tamer19_61250 [Cupriavidus sp. TA19]
MTYPNSPLLLKGALIHFGAPMLIPIPNIIVFQYNPESMTRSLTPWKPPEREVEAEFHKVGDVQGIKTTRKGLSAKDALALSQPYDPAETFSLVLELDATDALSEPLLHPVALVSGVADRIAAIEMLMYPPGESLISGLLGSVSASVSFSSDGLSMSLDAAAATKPLKRTDAPIVLFFWGPGRIVPVRITSLSIEEQQYSPLLYPIRAKATIGIRVLDLDDLVTVAGDPATGAARDIAAACYKFTLAQKKVLAAANLLNGLESAAGVVLPL